MTAPRIEGGAAAGRQAPARIVLRPMGPADAPAVAWYAASPGFFRFVPDVPDRLRRGYTLHDARAFIEEATAAWRAGWPTWAIEHEGALVGTIRIQPAPWHPGGAIGYGLHPDARGKGLAGEAVAQVMDWCRREGRQLPAARCDPAHTASLHVLRRCGFVAGDHGTWLPQA